MQVHTRLTYAWALKTKAAGERERIGDVCWHPRSGATARACGGCGAAVCIEKASSLQGVSEKYWARRATVPAAARRRLSADVATGDARKRTATGLRRQHRRLYSKNLECTWNSCGSKSVLARVQLRGVSVPCLVVRCGELGNGRPSQRARTPPTRSNIPSRDSLAAIGGRYGSTIRNVGASI